tara:strand:+ start:3286 stop:4119 length:834 start_codon:yes stop_codon:yes gene_type:complete
MLFFDQTDVTVNGTGILAQSASLDIASNVQPFKSVGKRGIINQGPVGPKQNSAQASYLIELDNEPNYQTVDYLRNFNSTTQEVDPLTLNFGGVSGLFYLQSYSLQAQPNSPIQASVSYVGFNQTSGQVKEKSGTVSYNASSGSGIAFGFSAYLTTTGTYSVPGDFAFSYDFSAAYTPIYRLGSTEPLVVKLMGGSETMSVIRTGIYDPSFSGVKASDVLFDMNGSTGIQIFGLKFLCDNDTSESLNINISGAVVSTTSVSYGVGQIALTETSFNKYF